MIIISEHFNYKNWENCIKLSNDSIEVIVTTDIGPRVISCRFKNGINLFGELDEDTGKIGGKTFKFYGGARFWHAPEDKIRSFTIDNNKINYKIIDNIIILLPDIEINTGIRKEIKIYFDPKEDNCVCINYRIYNKNLWTINFSPWILNLMTKNGIAIIPQEPYQSNTENCNPVRPVVLWSYTKMNDERFIWGEKFIFIKQNPNLKASQKIGILNRQGWIAYYINETLFIKKYKYIERETYPDFNVNTEIYTDSRFLELETLGPYKSVIPDKYLDFEEKWYLFKIKIDLNENSVQNYILPLL